MLRSTLARHGALALAIGALLAGGPASAEKPDFAGGGKGGGKSEQHQKQDRVDVRESRDKDARGERDSRQSRDARSARDERGGRDGREQTRDRDSHREATREHRYFEDRQRVVVHNYYVAQYRKGQCPPGLAKKRNGCMPPGLEKKWRIGERLPHDLVHYDLPPALLLELGPPPHMHKYVRVGADILLIAIGTGLIVDALDDLSGM